MTLKRFLCRPHILTEKHLTIYIDKANDEHWDFWEKSPNIPDVAILIMVAMVTIANEI